MFENEKVSRKVENDFMLYKSNKKQSTDITIARHKKETITTTNLFFFSELKVKLISAVIYVIYAEAI